MSAEPAGLQLESIGQIAINVHDLGRAVAFYRDTLGLRFLFQVPKMAFFDCAGVRLMLATPERPELDHPASIVYYRVADIQAAAATLRARGVALEGEPLRVHRAETHDLWLAFLRDPEGNLLSLMSEAPRRPGDEPA